MTHTNPHQGQPVAHAGAPLAKARGAMILLHGRGATAEGILDLADFIPHPGLAYLAPQAADYAWYPYSFLEPLSRNEPYLSSALATVERLVAEIEAAGIPAARIVLAGFSQGACLAAEYAARHAQRFGGLLIFSGGLIGPDGTPRDYPGSLDGTPALLGCSDADPYIPVGRVRQTATLFERMGAAVDLRIYPRMGHTINDDEIKAATDLVAGSLQAD
ncbi:MAG: dienelactone hydrolase family protein [Anaerolineae bacterium]|nr:dienelactone hydrolase family protein [Anaerolineae bacterium]